MGELGSLLTRAREARGLTLEDAERDTRISRRYLQALESEQFEVIPAPVYARGFLRSYSQYLGIDPSEALAMFPREEDPEYQRVADAASPAARATPDNPVSGQSLSRPTWRSEQPVAREPLPEKPAGRQPPPKPVAAPRPFPRPVPRAEEPRDPGWEPVIGVDIGVPNPARRLKTDPAAQTRSLVVAVVAIGVVVGAVLLALLISNLGGGDAPPGTSPDPTKPAASASAAAASSASAPSGVKITPGQVPTLVGLPEATAKQALAEAGYKVSELRAKAPGFEKGIIADQQPAAGAALAAGGTVQIVISEGQ
ncbi:MAG TPA: helix-turn-helix domain-containing protein [Tepidiformaceae bacterium]|nr:helix-turn-helix domain-containing protein [Tepidiformaceae bacterium]